MTKPSSRDRVRFANRESESQVIEKLVHEFGMSSELRERACARAADLVKQIREDDSPGLMEEFLAEYGLSSDEGVALMCLAEALLRVPDAETMDDLIEDKIVPSSWGEHLGKSASSLVNAATWGLLLTGKILDDPQHDTIAGSLRGAIRRLGEPLIRTAVKQAMKEMGRQFVLGETIESALSRGERRVKQGYSYSFDMLGEAALTQADADTYYAAYQQAISSISKKALASTVRDNPGISIKLSALHPRYERMQYQRVQTELVPLVLTLAKQAKAGGIGLNIDAEEADRLDLSLDVISAVLADPELAGWDGFGVVVQAYNKAAGDVIDSLYEMASALDRKLMVRLVKGAYWDSEIKHAQTEGVLDYPVFTRKPATDVSYLCCAQKLMRYADRLYPQFATHNAHTIAAILEMAEPGLDYEFQRLHGMGEALYRILMQKTKIRCRIYAPVGRHKDLLAYLVRRLLENGANSSFVNQIVDLDVPVEQVVADPFAQLSRATGSKLTKPCDLYQPERSNSSGLDLNDPLDLKDYVDAREPFLVRRWHAEPLLAVDSEMSCSHEVLNPADSNDRVGTVIESTSEQVDIAINQSKPWEVPSEARRAVLDKVADLYEQHSGEFAALLCREAGKTAKDVIAEIREAVDFLRYYGAQAQQHKAQASGLFCCISPWNFPLAIFTGQISAALAAGNAVLAKPAETTALVAALATSLFYKAGVPRTALQLLPGQGSSIGVRLTSDPKITGVCFTGSTATAQAINRNLADHCAPSTTLIAETGGINAMIVDSTALLEQAVTAVIRSAFQSAGQRCSALRILYVQVDILEAFKTMLFGALDQLKVGDPLNLDTDVGPVITPTAKRQIDHYIEQASLENRVLKQHSKVPDLGFVAPTIIEVGGIEHLKEEVFGPVLHLASFSAEQLPEIVEQINNSGFGLTFGLHTRIDGRVERLTRALKVGNIYVNRDQIGAIVGSQPFGGEGLSGTGPKAGGPDYLPTFYAKPLVSAKSVSSLSPATVSATQVQAVIDAQTVLRVKLSETAMPGITGESNQLSTFGRGIVLCLGDDFSQARQQAKLVEEQGCLPILVCQGAHGDNAIDGVLGADELSELRGVDVVVSWSNSQRLRELRKSLAKRPGKLVPLVCNDDLKSVCRIERHVCVDTTASGGNVSLLAGGNQLL